LLLSSVVLLLSAMPADYMSDSSDFEASSNVRDGAQQSRQKVVGGVAGVALLLLGAAALRGVAPAGNAGESQAMVKEEMVVVPAYEKCSKDTESCISTKCCKTTGYKCFMKDNNFAKCMLECVPGKDGWCSELVNTKPVASYPGLRFFCFAFYTADMGTTKPNYELSLIRTQLFLGASIFGCPKWAVYSDVDTWLSPGPPLLKTTKVYDVDGEFHILRRKDTGSYANTAMHYQAWLDIRNHKLASGSDWVIKSDIDAVFLPQRLLDTLKGYKVPSGGVYIENCKKVMFGFFGHLEVVSSEAFSAFLSSLESCKSSLDWKGQDPDWKYGPWGEDLFMQRCMDKIGVSKVSNFTLTTNGACKADLPKELQHAKGLKWKPDCTSTKTISLHPFKKTDEYFQCLAATQR